MRARRCSRDKACRDRMTARLRLEQRTLLERACGDPA
jgi:hypothetical protein